MTAKEISGIMQVLSVAYPSYYKNATSEEMKNAVALWAKMFKDDDALMVSIAVKAIISASDNPFPPTIGQVKAQMRKLYQPEEKSELEAWAEVRQAVKRSIYYAQEEFEQLTPLTKKAVGNAETLREWAMIDEDALGTVVASNFMRTYRAQLQNIKEMDALPEGIKNLIAGFAEKKRLN